MKGTHSTGLVRSALTRQVPTMTSKQPIAPPPTPFRADLQEYLEKYASDAMKREVDYEEAVWRSLPAFVTALGLLMGLLAWAFSIAASDLPAPLGIAAVTLCAVSFASALMVVWHLRFSIKKQRHRYPPAETEVCAWASELQAHQEALGLALDTAGDAVLAQVRALVLKHTAAAATNNQVLNANKLIARTRAAHWLFVTVTFTLASGAAASFVRVLTEG